MSLAIVLKGDETLSKTSIELTNEEVISLKPLLNDMVEFLKRDPNHLGLSLPQVGINKRAIVVKLGKGEPIIMVNPELMTRGTVLKALNEGCLSVPDETYTVVRSRKITLAYNTIDGLRRVKKIIDFDAFVVQHEIDHLNGILISDIGRKKVE